jgi:hypothetical protein
MAKRLVPAIALMLGGLGPLLLPAAAGACAGQYLDPIEHAGVVVTGVAVDRRPDNPLAAVAWLFGASPMGDVEYVIAVDNVERGDVGPYASTIGVGVHVFSGEEGMCGQSLELGTRYRFGADRDDGRLMVAYGAIDELPPLEGQPTIWFAGMPGWLLLPGAIIGFAIGGFLALKVMAAIRRRHRERESSASTTAT